MRLLPILLGAIVPILSAAQSPSSSSASSSSSDSTTDSTTIFLQPITSSSISETAAAPIHPLAKIAYNPSTLTSTLLSYSAPDLPDDPPPSLLRIGIYDPPSQAWKSSVSVTSPASFAKGYAPTFVVTLGPEGEVLGVSVKSALIDAGATRDFGPKVVVRAGRRARGPELNRPVVLGEDGKVGQVPLEKTLLQKYWWVGLVVVILLASGGGE